ncbi:hypothetical protein PHMEG_00018122 [Phytophthora megakarya]|uniref:Uncharacterized protein n=1 Tax=Phytophthora megakarya TaxID=4795 RepID=A0A225VUJ6_9STRA|nr:hypothetical protein PHMEG_00018122 [Phytophthora megakarya]
MVQGTLLPSSTPPTAPTSEATVVPAQGTDPAPDNTPSADADTTDPDIEVPSATVPADIHWYTGMNLAPVSRDAPPVYRGPEIHLVGVPASIVAMQGGAIVYPGHGGLEVLLCFESLDATDLQDPNVLMGGDVADCLLTLRERVAPVSLAAEVNSIAGQRELAALLGPFPLDRLAERMINSLSFIRRLLDKIRHLRAASKAEGCDTLSSETLVARENFNIMRREWTAMISYAKVIATLSSITKRIRELTDQVARLQAQLRDSEAARQAAERRAAKRLLDVNALVDFLMGIQSKINVMFNWMRLAALLHHFAEGTPLPEDWLTNINVIALDEPRGECPEYARPSPRTDNEAGRALPAGLLWTDVREEVQHLLLSGMDFKFAMKWVSDSQEAFYISAEGILRLRQANREPTPPWHPSRRCFIKVQKRKQSTRERKALQATLSGSSDDETQDPSYELSQAELDKAARAEAAAENKESSEESDEGEEDSKPAAASLSPANPREPKTVNKSDRGGEPMSHDGKLIRAPWTAMFYDRIIVFYFHEVRDLNSETLDGIKDYVDFMRINAKTWSAILHWLTISFLSRDAAVADASRDLYDERRRDVKRLRAQYEALLKRLFAIAGFPRTLLNEPGLVADYAAQLDDLDAEDPVRTQWAAAHCDDDIMATVPSFMHPKLMMPERRARNVIPLSAASQAKEAR